MNEIYFPSCNFNKASPEAAKRLRFYLKEKMPVAGCCRYDKTPWETGSIGLYFCQACRETLESNPDNVLLLENLFVWLDRQTDFPWPDYHGLVVNVQDCWRDRAHPEIFDAVRSTLKKMGVTILELEENRDPVLNAILLHYQELGEKMGISFTADIRAVSLEFMKSVDVTAIFGNLLENALRAAKGSEEPFVELSVGKREKSGIILISVSNSCQGEVNIPPRRQTVNGIHGIGLQSVKRTVKKYRGSIEQYFSAEQSTFHTIITLLMSRGSEPENR